MSPPATGAHVLVTGATGYIGARLVPRLAAAGHRVRCLVRDPARVGDAVAAAAETVVAGDVGDPASLARAMAGVDQAYYLVHAMRDGDADFRARDRAQAAVFARAAHAAGVRRLIYLGGLGDPDDPHLSEHLRSRHEVGAELAAHAVPVLEFRAAVIVGSGSASFEMLRFLTERLPVMITPRWVATRCQPIGIADVLAYLVRAQERPDATGIYEIGGADVLSYREMMLGYAAERGLVRHIVQVPVLTPSLSARWVDLVTPIPASIARPLIGGLRSEVVCREDRARATFGVDPEGYRAVVRRALRRIADDRVESVWCASFSALADRVGEGERLALSEGTYIEVHRRRARVGPERLFAACCRLGGRHGWPAGGWLWRTRALLDRLCGGVGMRRGRRSPERLAVGDPLDFWRVEALRPPQLLRLRAEMKLPGKGWLQFRVTPAEHGARLEVAAFFTPQGLAGFLYWYATKPLHRWIFPALVDALVRTAQRRAERRGTGTPSARGRGRA